jgi:hypothetical protein
MAAIGPAAARTCAAQCRTEHVKPSVTRHHKTVQIIRLLNNRCHLSTSVEEFPAPHKLPPGAAPQQPAHKARPRVTDVGVSLHLLLPGQREVTSAMSVNVRVHKHGIGGVEVWLHAFCTSAIDGGQQSASASSHFTESPVPTGYTRLTLYTPIWDILDSNPGRGTGSPD